MTSPQAATLDVVPADATSPTINNLHSANDGMDLTAEAQDQATTMPVEVDNSQQEHSDESNQQQPFEEPAEQSLNDSALQNEAQIPPLQGETAHGADAAIPNSEDLQNNNLAHDPSTMSAAELISTLTSLRDNSMMFGGISPYYPFTMEQMNAMEMSLAQQPFPDLDPEPLQEQQVQAYAKLDFEDGSVYMNTYNIYIGRDRKAAKKVLRRERLEALGEQPLEPRNLPPPVSESGGIIAHEEDYGSTGQPKSRKGRSKRSKASKRSHSSHSSQKVPREESPVYERGVYPFQYDGSDTEAAPVDPTSLRPNPNSCPTVGIHPRSNSFKAYKAISRRHVKIAFNPDTSVFELHVMGNNGCWIAEPGKELDNNCLLAMSGTKHVLSSGSQVQIGEVSFTFVLPNDDTEGACETVKDVYYDDEDGKLFRDARGKEMSTDHSQPIRSDAGDFSDDDSEDDDKPRNSGQPNGHGGLIDNGHDVEESADEDDEEDDEDIEEERESEEEDEEEGGEEDEQTQTEMVRQSIEEDNSPTNTKGGKISAVPGRKGPGRPPKNGVMSKRAEKELKKQAEEAAAAEKTGVESSEAPKKGKVGRPRKHPLPDPETANKPKRKYTKRKPKENQEGVQEGTGSGEGATATTKVKKEKPFKPARSPTPVYREEDLAPEQLVKPAENYVVIIYNSMLASPHKEMGLPQIYNAIKRAYPFFALKAETKGWESSVRHNLSGNPEVFEKGVKDGKGHMWSLKPGATVDKEKKKKAAPDPQFQGQPQNIQQAPHNPHGQYPGMNYAYANYHPHPNYPMGQPQFMPHPGAPYPPPPNGYAPQQNGFQQPPGPWQQHPPNYPPPSIPPTLIAPTTSASYSSPYAPKPAENNASPPNNQPHASPYGPPLPSEQRPPQQPSPPTTVPHPSPPQYQPQQQNQYSVHVSAPPSQMQYNPTAPQQHPTPPNTQQLAQHQPLYFIASQTQHQPQSKPQTPPIQQTPVVQQTAAAIQQPSPPQQSVETQPPPPAISKPSPDVAARIETMLAEFQRILMEKDLAKEDVIKASIALVRRDGDKAVPDPNAADKDKGSMKAIIDTLRGSLASIEGSGFTKPNSDYQRSFQPPSTTNGTSSQASAPVNGSSAPINRPTSTIPRPPLGVARPPMHTGVKRTDSGSPAIPGSIPRPASVPGGRALTPAAAGTPVPAQSGSANSPNGASAAISTPVSVSEGISKMQVPAVPTHVERPADLDVTRSVGEVDNGSNINGQPQQIVGQKRSRDEVDGLAIEGQENVKRVAV
jgi:hypothetical protein